MKIIAQQSITRQANAAQHGRFDHAGGQGNSLLQEWSNICAQTNYEGDKPNSAVFNIAQLLNHKKPDTGSGFYSHLLDPTTKPLVHMSGSQYSPDYLQNLKILIVDDESTARDLLLNLATSLGWQADAVASGAEAIEKISHNKMVQDYQLILMDWQMPHMNGFETCEKIRQLYLHRTMPMIIMVSASEQIAMAQQPPYKKALIDGYLLKPVTASTLILTSAALLHKENEAPNSSSAHSSLNNMSVLLVEDNRANQMIAMELLEGEGAAVILAENGEQALELLKNSKNVFDVVLMDIQMPVMDGYQATREIRQTLGLQQLPIVAMSANALQSDRKAALAAGMNEYIGKPFELTFLVEKLIQLCHWQPLKSARSSEVNIIQNSNSQNKSAENVLLNFAASVERFSGNLKVYQRALRVFIKDSLLLVATLPESLTSANHGDMLTSIHSIKGMAANLGAEALAAICKDMEMDFALTKQATISQAAYQRDLLQLQSALIATCQCIQHKLSDSPDQSGKLVVAKHKSELPESILQLAALLADSNLDALSLQQSLFDQFFDVNPALFQLLDDNINQFNFVEAEKICQQISASLVCNKG
jgi:two-component system, sensor histidine kinase and response regulator